MTGAFAYALVARALQPLLPLYLRLRLKRGKEIADRLNERYGLPGRPRPEGKLLWIHGASVGECMSALPLIECLLALNPELHIMLTSGTVASAQLIARRLPPRAFHQFIPLDTPGFSRRFLDHWRPAATLWLESELWPNLLAEVKARRLPAARLNARLTPRSAARWQRRSGWFRDILATFNVTLTIGRADAMRLEQAGAANVSYTGNLKFTAPAPAYDAAAFDALRDAIGPRPVWLMASSHSGEEEMALRLHQQLAERLPDLLTIIAPRHSSRAEEVAAQLTLPFARRSLGELPASDQPLYLADTMGELGLLYRAAGLTVVGGSFTPKGGHSPIEPAQCACATLIGPDTSKCEDAVTELVQAGALIKVDDEEELLNQLRRLLSDNSAREAMQQAGLQATEQQVPILNATLAALAPALNPAGMAVA